MMMGETEVLDVKEIVKRIGETLKIKDLSRAFKPLMPPPMAVVPDEQLAQGVDAGNYVPAGQA